MIRQDAEVERGRDAKLTVVTGEWRGRHEAWNSESL